MNNLTKTVFVGSKIALYLGYIIRLRPYILFQNVDSHSRFRLIFIIIFRITQYQTRAPHLHSHNNKTNQNTQSPSYYCCLLNIHIYTKPLQLISLIPRENDDLLPLRASTGGFLSHTSVFCCLEVKPKGGYGVERARWEREKREEESERENHVCDILTLLVQRLHPSLLLARVNGAIVHVITPALQSNNNNRGLFYSAVSHRASQDQQKCVH